VFSRFTASDEPDLGFGSNGVAHVDISGCSYDVPTSFVAQPDGTLLLLGSCSMLGDNNLPGVARVTATGTPDSTFGTNGVVCLADQPGNHDQRLFAAVQSDGKIVLEATDASYQLVVSRLDQGGGYDPAFGTLGRTTVTLQSGPGYPRGISVLPDGKILALATTSNDSVAVLARFTAGGALDTSFGTGGLQTLAVGAGASLAHSLAIEPDGMVVIGGRAANVGGVAGMFVLRVCPGG
jgi:uncharacterized delta-60 repeat protein